MTGIAVYLTIAQHDGTVYNALLVMVSEWPPTEVWLSWGALRGLGQFLRGEGSSQEGDGKVLDVCLPLDGQLEELHAAPFGAINVNWNLNIDLINTCRFRAAVVILSSNFTEPG